MSDLELLGPDALLHRQVHGVKADGSAMSSNFVPTPKDDLMLSTRQDIVIDAKSSFDQHVGAGFKSLGTWSFRAVETDLDVIDDQAEPGSPIGHASVDFRPLTTRGQRESAGKRIKAAAVKTYPTPTEDSG